MTRRKESHLAMVAMATALLCPVVTRAQADATARELESLRSTVQQLEKSLQEVRAKLAEMEQKQGSASATNVVLVVPVAAPVAAAGTTNAVASSNYVVIAGQRIELAAPPIEFGAQGQSPIRNHDTFNDYQVAAPRPDNQPIDPALVGFIPVPGTKSLLKFGGSARLDAIYDFADNGNPNQFIPSSIPVEGQAGADGGGRSQIHAKGTRISFEARRPVGEDGSLRIFNENDFFDDSSSSSMKFRVRHFYGQAWNLLVGQTYSAFMNIDAWPDVLDYAGPNAIINKRQPQVRFSPPIYDGVGKMHLVFSLEQPESDLDTGATSVPSGAKTYTPAPDGVAGWRWEGEVGHLQLAGLFREIGYEADNAPDDTVFGWGASASGAFNLFEADKLFWQAAYGEGMARYVNDLGGADLDAAPDDSGDLKALPVFAGTIGYTRQWSKQFRSTASYGYLHVDPTSSLNPLAIESTHYASANLVWHPTKAFRTGLEYLFGHKEARNGESADAHRINFVFRYDLIR